jgi:hypothetical protein
VTYLHVAPSDSSKIPAATRALGIKGAWPENAKRLCTLMLSRCSSTSNHGFPVLTWMARACPVKVAAGACMTDQELADWNNPAKHADGKAAIQKANETLYTTMALMADENSERGRAMNLAVDTGDIAIGEGPKLLEKFYDLSKQDATSMEDADDLAEEVTNFRSSKDESAQALVARFNALWLGWPRLAKKLQAPWHKGVCFNSLPSFGGVFCTKSARRPRQVPGQFPNRLEVMYKNASDWFYK